METPRIERISGGLQCDNPSCDWTDETVKVENYKQWLNAPCPKCGENVLTQEDFDTVLKVMEMVDLINALPQEGFEEFTEWSKSIRGKDTEKEDFYEKHNIPEGTKRVTVTFDIHNGIHIKNVKSADNE